MGAIFIAVWTVPGYLFNSILRYPSYQILKASACQALLISGKL